MELQWAQACRFRLSHCLVALGPWPWGAGSQVGAVVVFQCWYVPAVSCRCLSWGHCSRAPLARPLARCVGAGPSIACSRSFVGARLCFSPVCHAHCVCQLSGLLSRLTAMASWFPLCPGLLTRDLCLRLRGGHMDRRVLGTCLAALTATKRYLWVLDVPKGRAGNRKQWR